MRYRTPAANKPAAALAAAPGQQGASGGIRPGAKLAPSGQAPTAFVIHHTTTHDTPEEVVKFWRSQNKQLGSQFIVDRDGKLHDVEKEFGYTNFNHVAKDFTLLFFGQAVHKMHYYWC